MLYSTGLRLTNQGNKIHFGTKSCLETDTWDISMITLSPPSLSLDSWYTLPSYPSSQYSIHLHLITPLCSFHSQCLWSCRLQMSRLGWVTRQYQGSLNKCGPLIITDCFSRLWSLMGWNDLCTPATIKQYFQHKQSCQYFRFLHSAINKWRDRGTKCSRDPVRAPRK